MEYVQERITTLHEFSGDLPDVEADRAAVVLPMTGKEPRSPATTRILQSLEDVDPGRVVVPLRTAPERATDVRDWLLSFDLAVDVLPSEGESLAELLREAGVYAPPGKGRDVWLGIGVAASDHEYVICHDADTTSDTRPFVPRLLFPLEHGFRFSKGFYARIENGHLYGRLFRLFYVPLVRALLDHGDADILRYLDGFRYALAGEFGLTADLAQSLHVEPRWGLEVGTLGDAYATAGTAGTAQVDLGRYTHDHRGVEGAGGLASMATDVASALFRVVEAQGVTPPYDRLPHDYRSTAKRLVDQYAADCAFNGYDFDRTAERDQIDAYADAIAPPGPDDRLPAWSNCQLDPQTVLAEAQEPLAEPPEPSTVDD